MLLSQRPLSASDADAVLALPSRLELAARVAGHVFRERNTLLLGPRGSGRTSTLSLVERELRQREGFGVHRLDAGAWTGTADLVAAVLTALGHDRRGPTPRTLDPVRQARLGWSYDVDVPRAVDETDVQAIVQAAKAIPGASRTVVLIDNLHPEPAHDLFGRFRDTLWDAPVTWVAAGNEDHHGGYLREPADVFWERVEWLRPLTSDDVRGLLQLRIDAAGSGDEDVGLVQGAIDAIAERLERPTPRDVVRTADDVVDAGALDGGFGNAERLSRADAAGGRSAAMLLAEIEQLGRPVHAGDDELMARMGLTRPRLVQLLGVLAAAGLVDRRRDGKRVLFEAVRS